MAGATRWGIASAGAISGDFVQALRGLPAAEHQVVAVGARNLSNAEEFAKKYNIPEAYGSYEELAKDANVDIVYVGTIHPYHHAITTMVLNHGKHVLCEKPMGMNYQQSKEMIDLAKSKGLFLMEGLWSRFFPVYEKLREELKNETVGKANFACINFGANIESIARLSKKALGGGSMLDLGVYAVQMALLVYNNEEPEKIIATGILNDDGVDYCDCVTMYFKEKKIAQLNLHQGSAMKSGVVISGDKSYIEITNFWCPDTIQTADGKTHKFPVPEVGELTYLNSGGFQYEAQAVRDCLLKGKLEHELHPHSSTLLIAKCLDEVLRQVGVTY